MPTLITVQVSPQADMPSVNGRIYPKALLQKIAATTPVNHVPLVPLVPNQLDGMINFAGFMGVVTKLTLDHTDTLTARINLCDNPNGLAVQRLIEAGYRGSFSMVGRGTVENHVVQDDYQLDSIALNLDAINDFKRTRLRDIVRAKQRQHYAPSRTA